MLPFLNVGGVSYFKIESSDIADRPFERFSTYSVSLITIYTTLTLVCGLCYAAAGMSGSNKPWLSINEFDLSQMAIIAGDTVTWSNEGPGAVAHTLPPCTRPFSPAST